VKQKSADEANKFDEAKSDGKFKNVEIMQNDLKVVICRILA
jgi:hypothetical protein